MSIPKYIYGSKSYFLENGIEITNQVELNLIKSPNINDEFSIFIYNSSCQELVDKAKQKQLSIKIPSKIISIPS